MLLCLAHLKMDRAIFCSEVEELPQVAMLQLDLLSENHLTNLFAKSGLKACNAKSIAFSSLQVQLDVLSALLHVE